MVVLLTGSDNNCWTASKFLKMQETFSSDAELDFSEVMSKFNEKGIPMLGVNLKVLEDFSLNYSLTEANLDKLYSACSEVIHNQSPLPFFSLLEVKFFKHFLGKYIGSLLLLSEKIIHDWEHPSVERIHALIEGIQIPKSPFGDEKHFLKECINVAYVLEIEHGEEVKDFIRKAVFTLQGERKESAESSATWIKPLSLISLFHLISPSLRQLRDFSLIEEDLEDIVERMQPLSFKVSLKDEMEATLSKLQEIMSIELERYSVFSSLAAEKKKKVIFYLLINNLPRAFEETMRS